MERKRARSSDDQDYSDRRPTSIDEEIETLERKIRSLEEELTDKINENCELKKGQRYVEFSFEQRDFIVWSNVISCVIRSLFGEIEIISESGKVIKINSELRGINFIGIVIRIFERIPINFKNFTIESSVPKEQIIPIVSKIKEKCRYIIINNEVIDFLI